MSFWQAEGQIPQAPADEIRRQGEIRRKLEQLCQEKARIFNEKKLHQDLLKQRLVESKSKRKFNALKPNTVNNI